MRIIEITALDNGAHRNQNGFIKKLPDGWAIVPDELATENYPFGNVTVEEKDGVPVAVAWEPLPVPKPEEAEPAAEEATTEDMANAIQEGVNEV